MPAAAVASPSDNFPVATRFDADELPPATAPLLAVHFGAVPFADDHPAAVPCADSHFAPVDPAVNSSAPVSSLNWFENEELAALDRQLLISRKKHELS